MLVKKKIVKIVTVIVVLFIIGKIFFNPYARISRYVNRNQGNLKASCEFYLENGIVDKQYSDIKVDGIFGENDKIVQFYVSGKGIAPASVYYGFYYSPADIPVSYCNDNYRLESDGKNQWKWNGTGDNGGKIRKICENWYYYEAWF